MNAVADPGGTEAPGSVAGGAAPLVVVRTAGYNASTAAWRDALEDHPEIIITDVPGTIGVAAPLGGNYDMLDPAFALAQLLVGRGDERLHIVALGSSGWSATLFAIAGRAASLVLVDGLGGPFVPPEVWPAERRRVMRTIVDSDEMLMPHADLTMPDPRLSLGRVGHGDKELAANAATLIDVPVLVLETPASGTDAADADDLTAAFPKASMRRIARAEPATIVHAISTWQR